MPSSHCWLCHFLISFCLLPPCRLLHLFHKLCRPSPAVAAAVAAAAATPATNSSSSNLPDCLTVIVGSHMLSNWQTTPAPNQFPQNTQQQRRQQRSISFPTAPSCLLLLSCLASSSSSCSPSPTHCKRNILRYSRVLFCCFAPLFIFVFACLAACLLLSECILQRNDQL